MKLKHLTNERSSNGGDYETLTNTKFLQTGGTKQGYETYRDK